MSQCFRFLAYVRHKAFDLGIFKTSHFNVPIVSIGNITAGGTGKTPMVKMISKDLQKFGQTSVISRGYRSKMERNGAKLPKTDPDPRTYGDEPAILASELKDVMVFIGKNKTKSIRNAIRNGTEFIVMDDGFQSRRIGRNFDIVLFSDEQQRHCKHFLPLGILRDPFSRLRQADVVCINHVDSKQIFFAAKERLSSYTKSPIIWVDMHVNGIDWVAGTVVSNLHRTKVGIFCGLGTPTWFKKTVERLGCNVVTEMFVRDHKPLSDRKLKAFAEDSIKSGCKCILCSAKDAVKIKTFPKLAISFGIVNVSMIIKSGSSEYNNILFKIQDLSQGKCAS